MRNLTEWRINMTNNRITNEEWFCNLPTKEKAMLIAAQGKYNTPENMKMMLFGTAKTIEEWFNKLHVEEDG